MEKGKQDSICMFLVARFGDSSYSIQERVRTVNDLTVLNSMLKKVFEAKSLEDAQSIINQAVESQLERSL